MGYSIYWYREKSIDQAIFKKILNDFAHISFTGYFDLSRHVSPPLLIGNDFLI